MRDFGYRTRKPPQKFSEKSRLSQKRLKHGKKYFVVICLKISFHPYQHTFGSDEFFFSFFSFIFFRNLVRSSSVADPENFGGGDNKNFKHKTSKIQMSSLKFETDFSAEIGNSNVFSAQNTVVSKKKKKVFTGIETDFSEIRTFFPPKIRWSPKKKTSSPKRRLIFRPKSLGLGWWGGCTPKWRLIFRNGD